MIKNQFESNSNYNNILAPDGVDTGRFRIGLEPGSQQGGIPNIFGCSDNIDNTSNNENDNDTESLLDVLQDITKFSYDKLNELMLVIFLVVVVIISLNISELLDDDYEAITKKDTLTKEDLVKLEEVTNKINNSILIIVSALSLFIFTIIYDVYDNSDFYSNMFNIRSHQNLFNDLISNFNVEEIKSKLRYLKEKNNIKPIRIQDINEEGDYSEEVENIFSNLYNNEALESKYIENEGFYIVDTLNDLLQENKTDLLLHFFKENNVNIIKKKINIFSKTLDNIKNSEKSQSNPIPLMSISNSISGYLTDINELLQKVDIDDEKNEISKELLAEEIDDLKKNVVENDYVIFNKLNEQVKYSGYYNFLMKLRNNNKYEIADQIRDIIYDYIKSSSRLIDIKNYNDDKYLIININDSFRIMMINIVCAFYLVSNMFLDFNINYDNNLLSNIIIYILLFCNFYFSRSINTSTRNIAFILLLCRIVLSILSQFNDKLYIEEISNKTNDKSLFNTIKYIEKYLDSDLKEKQLPLNSFEREKQNVKTRYNSILVKKTIINYLDMVLLIIIIYSILTYSGVILSLSEADNNLFNEIPKKGDSDDEIPKYIINTSSNLFVNTPKELNIYASLERENGKQTQPDRSGNYYMHHISSLVTTIIACSIIATYKYVSAPFLVYIFVSILLLDNNNLFPKLDGDNLFNFKLFLETFILIGMVIWYIIGMNKLLENNNSEKINDGLGFHLKSDRILSNIFIKAEYDSARNKLLKERNENTAKANTTMFYLLLFYATLRYVSKFYIIIKDFKINNMSGGSIDIKDYGIWFYLLIFVVVIFIIIYYFNSGKKDNVEDNKNKKENNIYELIDNLKQDKKLKDENKKDMLEQKGGTINKEDNLKVKEERRQWNLIRIISIVCLIIIFLSHLLFKNEENNPNRYQGIIVIIFTLILSVILFPVIIYLTRPTALIDIKGYISGIFMTNDVESRLTADNNLISIILFVALILFLVGCLFLIILPSEIINFSLFKSFSTIVLILFSITVIIKYLTNKNEKSISDDDLKKINFMNNINSGVVYYQNDEMGRNKIIATPSSLRKKKDNILNKIVDNIKTNLDTNGYFVSKILIDSLKNKLKSYQIEPIELTDNLNNTSKYILNNIEIDETLSNIKNGQTNMNFKSLLGGNRINYLEIENFDLGQKGGSSINYEEIKKENIEKLELFKEKLNIYKILEGKYKIKLLSEMKDDIFICVVDIIYGDIVNLSCINSRNEVLKFLTGRIVKNSEDESRLDIMDDINIHGVFKKLNTNEYELEVNQRDYKRMNQAELNKINDLLQEEILFKDLTKIIDISKDHKYIQEYNLLEYLIEYKRIKNISSLSDEKMILESIISNIVLLIDSLKKAEYNKTNYNKESKDSILLSAQTWFNNLTSLEELYNLLIKLNEFDSIIDVTDSNINIICKNIIDGLKKIKETKQGISQLKLQRHKIIIQKIKKILEKYSDRIKEETKSTLNNLIMI